MKVAIVHDWLTGMRGGEKCLEVFCELFPDATLFTLLHVRGSVSDVIENMAIKTSFLQGIPNISKNYRSYLPFFPMAVEKFDLAGYDLVLSSSHCVAKGVRKPSGAVHVSYCYTPVRYAWKFYEEYFSDENRLKRWFISKVINRLREWDLKSNKSVDCFVAISDNVKSRIKEYYDRDADIIYPPVDEKLHDEDGVSTDNQGYYLVVSALVPYKRVDIAVDAFTGSGRKLIIVGSGGEYDRLKERAGSNVEFRGWAQDADLIGYYKGCKALLFPGEEDFGIVPVEAQMHGKPVIAYGRGGALETVMPFVEDEGAGKVSGVFFDDQTADSLNRAVDIFERNERSFDPKVIRGEAFKFNRERFKREIDIYVRNKFNDFKQGISRCNSSISP